MEKNEEKKYIVSTAVRAYRNVDGVNFVPRLSKDDSEDVSFSVKNVMDSLWGDGGYELTDVNTAEKCDLLRWCESNCCALKAVPQSCSRFIFSGNAGQSSVVTNEAEHILIQTKINEFSLDRCFSETATVTNALSKRIPFAADTEFGFLTANPLLSGTGLRASVTLHLPALTLSPSFNVFFERMNKKGIAVKGAYAENMKAFGAFWIIANEYTRGITEEETVEAVKAAAEEAVSIEETKRSELIGKRRQFLFDTVWRSLSVLGTSRLLTMREFVICMSNVRLGAELGIFDTDPLFIDETLLHGQPGYISAYAQRNALSEGQSNDYIRARIIREDFAPLLKKAL